MNRIWGYESHWGSFAQFSKVQVRQLLPKPGHLTWKAAAAYTLVGAAAWRMQRGFPPHVIEQGDPVPIWGGAGGLGTQAIQTVREFGGRLVAAVSEVDNVN